MDSLEHKSERLRDAVSQLRRRLGGSAFEVVDYWPADPDTIGIARPDDFIRWLRRYEMTDSRAVLVDWLRSEFAAEERDGFPRLKRVPDTGVIRFLDHFASLDAAKQADLAAVLADWSSYKFLQTPIVRDFAASAGVLYPEGGSTPQPRVAAAHPGGDGSRQATTLKGLYRGRRRRPVQPLRGRLGGAASFFPRVRCPTLGCGVEPPSGSSRRQTSASNRCWE
jgi:hypothetical protein